MLTVASVSVFLSGKHPQIRCPSDGSKAELADGRVRPAYTLYRARYLARGVVVGILLVARRKKAAAHLRDLLEVSFAIDARARPERIAGQELALR